MNSEIEVRTAPTTQCNCGPNQYPFHCNRHHCEKGVLWHRLCRSNTDIFKRWEAGTGPGHVDSLPAYRTFLSAPECLGVEDFPCIKRGLEVRATLCKTCGGRDQKVTVYGCAVYGECSIHAHGLRRIDESGKLAVCIACKDRESSTNEDAIIVAAFEHVATESPTWPQR